MKLQATEPLNRKIFLTMHQVKGIQCSILLSLHNQTLYDIHNYILSMYVCSIAKYSIHYLRTFTMNHH